MTMQAYPHYRDSGVDFVGDVPSHWTMRRLKDVGRLVAGAGFPEALQGVEGEELPFFKVADLESASRSRWMIRGNHSVSRETAKDIRARVIPAGSVVYAKIGAALLLNRRRVTTAPCCIDNNMSAFVPFPDVVTTEWALSSLSLLDFRRYVNPGAVPSLSEGDQSLLPVPLPPADEQRSITAWLDRETERIDALVEKKRLLIERLEEYRTALITRTVTRGLPPEAARAAGLDPSPRLKASGVEWLGDVPEHWEVARLKWSSSGAINGVWGDEPDGENDIACVRVADFDRRNLTVNFDDPTFRAVSPSQRSGRELRRGDLLLEKSGGGDKQPVGCVVLFDHDEPAVSSNFIARIATVQGNSPGFWTYVHAALYSGKLNYPAIKQTTGIQNLDSGAYFDTPVAFPPPREQQAIATFLDRETDALDLLHRRIGVAIERLQEHRTSLITAAVTGKIDVRELMPYEETGAGDAP